MARHAQFQSTQRNRMQRGFTLVELLVVITIIGVLMAMLIPAVGRVREYAHRVQCISNQSQIGLAMTLYATTKGKMPSTLSTFNDPLANNTAYTLGWAEGLMSQLGRGDLTPGTLPVATLQTSLPNIAILICPSDPTKVGTSGIGPLSYVVNGGGFITNYSYSPPDWNQNGAWNYSIQNVANQTVTTRTLDYIARHDGTSTTISHSENLNATTYIPPSTQSEYTQAILWDSTVMTLMNSTDTGNTSNTTARPSSNHPGGAVVGFCDGSVKFIQQTIAYNVYATLMTSCGAQANPAGTAIAANNAYYKLQVIPLDASQIPTN
jgi:prepilin-type N-terminal cleavage/methylation domain-containing protein/prepilin-type processing-associated H-X9-DG protein